MSKNGKDVKITLSDVGDFLAKLTEHSDHVYWISSKDFKRIQYISPSYERIWGRAREELYSNPEIWINFLHPDDAQNHHPIHDMAKKIEHLGAQARYAENYRIIRPNGEIRWIIDNGFPVYDAKGNCVGVSGIAIDVTEQKQTEILLQIAKEKAEAANRAKSEFIANMSHDIRTPLSGVIGIAEILEKLEQNPKLKQYARDVQGCGEQLLNMLDSILDVISADHSKEQDIVEETFDLRQFIQQIVDIEKPTIVLKNLDLNVDISANTPQLIVTDRTKLHRILLNLISNAVKFTNTGLITICTQVITLKETAVIIQFSITDTGIGISEEQQSHVFERFFRATPSCKGQYAGHGIGLHIAQSYVQSLGSEIKLSSQQGKGTTFYFELHCNVGQARNLATDHEPSPYSTNEPLPKVKWNDSPPNLLLIEDNPVALKVLEAIVLSQGLNFISKMNGEAALETAKKNSFHLVITDIGLPGISGDEFAKQLRKWEKANDKKPVPIIALTAHAKNEVAEMCLASGIDDLFSKPISPKVFSHIINKYLQNNIKKANTTGQLGSDLPNTEKELFQLNHFSVLNIEKALSFVENNEAMLKQILNEMANQEIPKEKRTFAAAYAEKDWHTIEKLAHKIKGGAVYVGTEKLKYACQYLERYHKAGHSTCLKKLYNQMIKVLNETQDHINMWLQNE